ncbi:MAG: dienelactone hydrolase family protein [Planctomycetota bacterium]
MNTRSQTPQRRRLYRLMGDLPPRGRKVACRVVGRETRDAYELEKLVLDLNGVETVPAYFTRPRGATGRLPVVVFNHAHGGRYDIGKEEMTNGRDALQKPPYAEFLAGLGCAALCIDHWCFRERAGRMESEVFKEMLWKGRVLWGMMVYDTLKAVDYLATRPDVDMDRVASVGISMGSTMAWWHAALDTRVKVCIDICCLTDFEAIIASRGLDGHGIYYFVPSLLKHFDTAGINALIAPRAHLSLAGNYDRLTPPEGLDRVDRELRKVYRAAGAPDAWKLLRYESGHFESAEMRAAIAAFLRDRL